MRQLTLASQSGFEKYARKNRKEEFLSTTEAIVPWFQLEELIAPYYPKAGNRPACAPPYLALPGPLFPALAARSEASGSRGLASAADRLAHCALWVTSQVAGSAPGRP